VGVGVNLVSSYSGSRDTSPNRGILAAMVRQEVKIPNRSFDYTNSKATGRSRTRWRDYMSNLVWSRLGVEPAELWEAAAAAEINRVLFRSRLRSRR